MAVVNIQDGSTCLFWFDLWGGQVQNHTYPELFSFAKNKLLSVQKALEVEPFHRMFHLPLSEEAFQQMELLHQLLQEQYFSDSTDLWHYIWGSPLFSSKKAYLHLTGHAQVHAVFSWLWKSSCQNKHKVFFWLLLKDRLSTRNILRRKTMVLDSYACELCNTGQEETLEHLFFQCPFAVSCWNLLHLQVPLQATVLEIMDSLAAQLRMPIFMNILILLCWTIWCTRNGVIFENQSASLPSCKVFFKKEITLLLHRVKPKHQVCLEE